MSDPKPEYPAVLTGQVPVLTGQVPVSDKAQAEERVDTEEQDGTDDPE